MDYKLIPLSGKNGAGLQAKVSPEDYDKCIQHSWWLDSNGYPTTKINSKPTRMHLFLTGKKYSDHINEDKLDNRRSNLFAGGPGPNQLNRNLNVRKTSKYPGVSWDKRREKWRAQTSNEGKSQYLGIFKDELDAAYAYYIAARKRHPYMNPPAWQTLQFLAKCVVEQSKHSSYTS